MEFVIAIFTSFIKMPHQPITSRIQTALLPLTDPIRTKQAFKFGKCATCGRWIPRRRVNRAEVIGRIEGCRRNCAGSQSPSHNLPQNIDLPLGLLINFNTVLIKDGIPRIPNLHLP